MAGSKSDYAEKQVLDCYFGGTAITPPATLYLRLFTTAYADDGSMTEVSNSGTGYAAVAVANNDTNWPDATGTDPTVKQNGTTISFVTATGSWGTVQSFGVFDAATGGNMIYGADLTTPKAISSGDTATFAANSLQIQED